MSFLGWLGLVPVQVQARQVLKERLKHHGVPPSALSDECLDDLTQFARAPWRQHVRANLRQNLEHVAINVSWIFEGEELGSLESVKAGAASGENNINWEIIVQNHPDRFAVENLEQTQASFRQTSGYSLGKNEYLSPCYALSEIRVFLSQYYLDCLLLQILCSGSKQATHSLLSPLEAYCLGPRPLC